MANRAGSLVAGAIAVTALACSFLVLAFGRFDPGIQLIQTENGLVVGEVDPMGPGAREGVTSGHVVVAINGVWLYDLPRYDYPIDPQNPDAEPEPVLAGPPSPTPVDLPPEELSRLASQPITSLELAFPGDLATYTADNQCCFWSYWNPGNEHVRQASAALLPGLLILIVGSWWLESGRAGEALRPLGIAAAVAISTPFLVQPMIASFDRAIVVAAGALMLIAMLPLAFALAERIGTATERQRVLLYVALLVAVGGVASVLRVVEGPSSALDALRWVAVGAIPLLPGLAAAGPLNLGRQRGVDNTSRNLLRSTELALVGATPLFALLTEGAPFVWPLALWLGAIAIAGRFTIRPLARVATRAQLQRDLVVAATEAERARVAADIHDDALQELTLLVRRLEANGDAEGAELGRTIAERLRAICGDLRLPILDDLGVGPALDWLVLRIERLAGGEVRLEQADGSRPPPDVELAVFRIAQEALANAVKHGAPPIVVRYRSTESGVSLSIDDAGAGIPEDAGETAEREGRFGLLNMQQRAEQIGAILDVRRWPSGGTHVALEWRAP
jgi:signal transduction histidine kinase